MGKLKVLIVDDEHLIRNLLRMRIDWGQQGMVIVGEASNAQEALELVDEHKPDIIFTDICMPLINGIEFSSRVLEKDPDIKIVIVTGHDDFEYARKSIKIGIFDYILKPIRSTELLSVTEKLKGKILEERAKDKELQKLKDELQQNFPHIRERFLFQWINGTLSKDEIYEKAYYFKVPIYLDRGVFQIAVIEVNLAVEMYTEEQLILLSMECRNNVELFYQSDSKVIILTDTKNQIVIISLSQSINLVADCELLITNLTQSYQCSISIGIGCKHENIQEAHAGYLEAYRALHYQSFVGKNQVICFEDIVTNRDQPYRSNLDLLQQLQFYISVGSSERATQILNHVFDVPFSAVSQFRMAAMDVIIECQRAAMEHQIEDKQILTKEMIVRVLKIDNLPELLTVLDRYVHYIAKTIFTKNRANEDNLITHVKEFLEKNMSDPNVGVTSTAEAFFVSPGHLGRLMKKETGQTFVEYLTNIRMKRAEALLKQTNLKGYEIGEQVGITDPHYFSVLFKKSTGRSMNEYRNYK